MHLETSFCRQLIEAGVRGGEVGLFTRLDIVEPTDDGTFE